MTTDDYNFGDCPCGKPAHTSIGKRGYCCQHAIQRIAAVEKTVHIARARNRLDEDEDPGNCTICRMPAHVKMDGDQYHFGKPYCAEHARELVGDRDAARADFIKQGAEGGDVDPSEPHEDVDGECLCQDDLTEPAYGDQSPGAVERWMPGSDDDVDCPTFKPPASEDDVTIGVEIPIADTHDKVMLYVEHDPESTRRQPHRAEGTLKRGDIIMCSCIVLGPTSDGVEIELIEKLSKSQRIQALQDLGAVPKKLPDLPPYKIDLPEQGLTLEVFPTQWNFGSGTFGRHTRPGTMKARCLKAYPIEDISKQQDVGDNAD